MVQSIRTRLRLYFRKHNNQLSVVDVVAVAVESESTKPDTWNVGA
jgi:hypothetical protein